MNKTSVSMTSNSAANFFKISATALIAISAFTFSASSLSAVVSGKTPVGAENSQAHKKLTENQTMAFANMMRDYRQATKPNKQNMKRELIVLAAERQALLADLVEIDPAAAVRAVLPASVRKGMPEEVKAMLTEKRELKGELEVIYEDHEDESQSRLRHTLITDAGRVELHLPANAKTAALQTGAQVRVKGWLFDDKSQINTTLGSLVLSDEQDSLVLAAGGSTATTSTATTALANTFGEQRTLVLLLNFQDNASEQPWTVEQARTMVFDTVSDFYRENSHDQTWLTGDVQGYLTLPIDATCDFGSMDSYAQQAAKNSGIDVSGYDRLVYLFPKNSDCGWRGQGTVSGTPSRAWINGELNLLTIGHEIGHNLGLHHAKYIGCGSDNIGDSCTSLEYGDNLDIMGKSTGHFNAFNKERLGWLSAASGDITIADSDGSYLIEPYEAAPGGTAKAIKVRRGTDASTGLPLWYHLEYRQAIGFDSFLEGKNGITDGVLVHLNVESDIESSQFMDMTLNSSFYDLDDAALVAGHSYQDLDAGVTITTEWTDTTGASVSVSYAGKTCVKANPGLSLSPNESAWVTAGSVVAYSATVTNNDSAECTTSKYDISAAIPTGWTVNNTILDLAPGASSTVTLNVGSTDTTAAGFYDITISAENSTDSHYYSNGIVSYVVDTPIEVCVQASPLFTLPVNNSGELAPGATMTYSGTLVSQDSSSCASSDFDISASIPADWTADNSSVNLAPGESANISLSVTSSSSAVDGFYAFDISAQNRTDSTYSQNLVAAYIVATPLASCVATAPSIVVSNKKGSDVAAGTQVNYSATVTNQDSDACAEVGFDVSADVPAGWSASTSNVKLMPGASTVIDIKVASDAAATEGLYNFSINAQSSSDSSYSASDTVSYSVATLVNTAPVANNDTITMSAKEAVIINVLGNDGDPENDTLSIVSVSQGAKGNVQITSGDQVLYTPAKSFKSSDSFSYTISDGDKTATAFVKLSLSTSGSGGGNKGKGKG